MRNLCKTFLLGIFFISSIGIPSFIEGQSVDTVSIFKNKSRQGYAFYWFNWFEPKKLLYKSGSVEFSCKSIFTHQDSMVENPPNKAIYYKVYDAHNRLFMEGRKQAGDDTRLMGDIRYFYKNGKLERVEHWGDELRDSCTHEYLGFDGNIPIGTWIYYRKDGTIFKTVFYCIEPLVQNDKTNCSLIAQTTTYSRKRGKRKQKNKVFGDL